MVVTGDRDAFQLIDPESRVQRDGHGARHHRHQALRPPGGDRPLRHRARADPRLLRPQGRHVGQHPRRPGHRRQDRRRPAAALRRPRDDPRLGRRDLRRQAQGEPHQPRRRRAHVQGAGDDPRRHRRSTSTRAPRPAREPDRSRLREVFREFELRDPLQRLEEALGRSGERRAAAAPRSTRSRCACARARVADLRALGPARLGGHGRA